MSAKLFLVLISMSMFYLGCADTAMYEKPKRLNAVDINEKVIDDFLLTKPSQLDMIYVLGKLSILESKDAITTLVILDKIDRYTINKISGGFFDKNDLSTRYLIDTLEECKYYHNLYSPSDFQKLILYFKEGRYEYIFDRLSGSRFALQFMVVCVMIPLIIMAIYIKLKYKK